MWAEESVFYQIYPLGFVGAPRENDGNCVNRIRKVMDWIPHMKRLHITAVYFSPVFQSDSHGYDTRDYREIDGRLGSNEDFAQVVRTLHEAGIRVVLDGVFNHVGRGFWAFRDVQERKWDSPYKDWFHINFGGDSGYGDGFWYEGWEGHYELVKLNLGNEEVVSHLLGCVQSWVEAFDIDGLRLDVAYSLDRNFMHRLREFTAGLKEDFWLAGEVLHGDYNQIVNEGMLHSCTNYECYKGLYSSFNSRNLFEICHSLNRQFGPENWTLYKGKHLLCFADNHDVTRVASILADERHLPLLYAVLFGMPGIPCIYYGSEWGAKGRKEEGDWALRPCFGEPLDNELCAWVAKLSHIHQRENALLWGGYRTVVLTNRQCVFERSAGGERIFVAVNADGEPYTARFDAGCARLENLLAEGETVPAGELVLSPYTASYWKAR